jgi:diacylglycerol O-acyltransferase / wax synthase
MTLGQPDSIRRFSSAARTPMSLSRSRSISGPRITVPQGERPAAGQQHTGRAHRAAPPTLHVGLAMLLYATRLFNLTIINVPGPPERLYSFDAPLTDIVPVVPLAADHAVGIAVISYAGRMTFGLIADRASVPDLDVLKDGIAASLFELASLLPRPRQARAHRHRSATRANGERR